MHNGFVPVSRGEKKFDINSNVSLNVRSGTKDFSFRGKEEEKKRRKVSFFSSSKGNTFETPGR